MKTIAAESIIFDLDGTLWDSSDNVAKSWNQAARAMGEPLLKNFNLDREALRSGMGKPMDELARHCFPMLPVNMQLEVLNKCMAYENKFIAKHGGNFYDNEESTLKDLAKNHRLFIVSNCQCGYIEAFYEYSGFEKYFVGNMCWGDTHKPKSKTIKLLMDKFRCESAVYVGDTDGDCNSAFDAGIPFIYAAYGFGKIHAAERVFEAVSSFSQYSQIIS